MKWSGAGFSLRVFFGAGAMKIMYLQVKNPQAEVRATGADPA